MNRVFPQFGVKDYSNKFFTQSARSRFEPIQKNDRNATVAKTQNLGIKLYPEVHRDKRTDHQTSQWIRPIAYTLLGVAAISAAYALAPTPKIPPTPRLLGADPLPTSPIPPISKPSLPLQISATLPSLQSIPNSTSASNSRENLIDLGNKLLEKFGYDITAGVDCKPYSFNDNSTLEKYLSDLKEQGCRQILSPEDLKQLADMLHVPVGELNIDQARNMIYHAVIDTIGKIQENFETEDCLIAASHASKVRNHALKYTRSLISPWLVSLLEGRDNTQYGGTRDEFAYFVGKYASENKTDICNKIIQGAKRPNPFYDIAARIYSSWVPFSGSTDPIRIQPMIRWLQENHTITESLSPPLAKIDDFISSNSPFYTGTPITHMQETLQLPLAGTHTPAPGNSPFYRDLIK